MYLDTQLDYAQKRLQKVNVPMTKHFTNSPEKERQGSPTNSEHLVPGIHNISSVGSQPLKRGVKPQHIVALHERDKVYHSMGAGQISSKVNNKWELPAMLAHHGNNVLDIQRYSP